MLKIVIIAIIMTSGLFANLSHTDSTESIRLNPKYSLGSVIGGVGLISPKFIATNIFDNYEFQLMAMHDFGNSYVAEMDLNYVLLCKDNFSHSVGIGGGYRYGLKTHNSNFFRNGRSIVDSFGYVGSSYAKLNYSLNWNFVFVQLGTAIGNNDYAVPRFTLQLGLLYHFK